MPDRGVRCPDPRSRKGDHEPRYEGRWACMFCGAVLRLGTWYDPLDFDGLDEQSEASADCSPNPLYFDGTRNEEGGSVEG